MIGIAHYNGVEDRRLLCDCIKLDHKVYKLKYCSTGYKYFKFLKRIMKLLHFLKILTRIN